MTKIVLVTPSGGRPEGLQLLAGYLEAQTYQGPAKWVIVDDCDTASPIPDSHFEVQVIRPSWRWKPGDNTQCRSMALALSRATDIAIVLEDDDCYLPNHIETTLKELETAELVGERMSRYYNVATKRWQLMPGTAHASLASVGVRGAALDLLRRICAGGTKTIDMDLWRGFTGNKRLTEHSNVVGIKGLPGRAGIGVGHRSNFGTPDTDNTLRKWLGDLAENYEAFRV